jgi:hypothetical protein
VLAALVAGFLVLAAPAGHAASESFKVISVDTPGCDSGSFGMTVNLAGLDGVSTYHVRTVATVAGLVYMNEDASISTAGSTTWHLFNIFTYGAVSNQGTWPIPQNKQVRMDFTLELPKGTVLFAWSTVVDGCNTGKVLYNALTSRDKDKDLVPTPKDRCPKLPAARVNGCPLRDRSLTLAYDEGGRKFFGFLFAEGFPKLYRGRTVTIWKVRPGADLRIGAVTTTMQGSFVLPRAHQTGVYYALSKGLLVPSAGQVATDTSLRVRLS